MRCQSRQTTGTAVQWDGTNATEIHELIADLPDALVNEPAEEGGALMVYESGRWRVPMTPGYWLMRNDQDGFVHVLSPDAMEHGYE